MTKPVEVVGEIVDEVRSRRRKQERVSEIVDFLAGMDMFPGEISNYLVEAFCLEGIAPSLQLFPTDESGKFLPEYLNRRFEPIVDQRQESWIGAGPYPDLMRRRDRHAFRAVARRTGNIIVVHAASRTGASYIGREGFRPCPVHLWGIPQKELPHAGLIAADPNEPALIEMLASAKPPKTYEQYVDGLKRLGFRVGGQEEGYVIRDGNNHAFYPGYYIHGVYNEHGVNAWTGREGEKLRAELNRGLGEDLVQHGPHDVWDQRLGGRIPAALSQPMAPVLLFFPGGNVTVRLTVESLRSYYEFLNINWSMLYPDETGEPEEAS